MPLEKKKQRIAPSTFNSFFKTFFFTISFDKQMTLEHYRMMVVLPGLAESYWPVVYLSSRP